MQQYIKKNWEIVIILTLSAILIIAYFPFISSRLTKNTSFNANYASNNHALSERVFYTNVSRETFSRNFTTGSGLGAFIFQIDGYLKRNSASQNLECWKYQPVHNIYLLICSEIGIVGFVIFCLIITEILSNSFNITGKTTKTKHF